MINEGIVNDILDRYDLHVENARKMGIIPSQHDNPELYEKGIQRINNYMTEYTDQTYTKVLYTENEKKAVADYFEEVKKNEPDWLKEVVATKKPSQTDLTTYKEGSGSFYDYNPEKKTVKVKLYRGAAEGKEVDSVSYWTTNKSYAESYVKKAGENGKLYSTVAELPVYEASGNVYIDSNGVYTEGSTSNISKKYGQEGSKLVAPTNLNGAEHSVHIKVPFGVEANDRLTTRHFMLGEDYVKGNIQTIESSFKVPEAKPDAKKESSKKTVEQNKKLNPQSVQQEESPKSTSNNKDSIKATTPDSSPKRKEPSPSAAKPKQKSSSFQKEIKSIKSKSIEDFIKLVGTDPNIQLSDIVDAFDKISPDEKKAFVKKYRKEAEATWVEALKKEPSKGTLEDVYKAHKGKNNSAVFAAGIPDLRVSYSSYLSPEEAINLLNKQIKDMDTYELTLFKQMAIDINNSTVHDASNITKIAGYDVIQDKKKEAFAHIDYLQSSIQKSSPTSTNSNANTKKFDSQSIQQEESPKGTTTSSTISPEQKLSNPQKELADATKGINANPTPEEIKKAQAVVESIEGKIDSIQKEIKSIKSSSETKPIKAATADELTSIAKNLESATNGDSGPLLLDTPKSYKAKEKLKKAAQGESSGPTIELPHNDNPLDRNLGNIKGQPAAPIKTNDQIKNYIQKNRWKGAGIGLGVGVVRSIFDEEDDSVITATGKAIKTGGVVLGASYLAEIGLDYASSNDCQVANMWASTTVQDYVEGQVAGSAQKMKEAADTERKLVTVGGKIGTTAKVGAGIVGVASILDIGQKVSDNRKAKRIKHEQEKALIQKEKRRKEKDKEQSYGYIQDGEILFELFGERTGHHKMGSSKFM